MKLDSYSLFILAVWMATSLAYLSSQVDCASIVGTKNKLVNSLSATTSDDESNEISIVSSPIMEQNNLKFSAARDTRNIVSILWLIFINIFKIFSKSLTLKLLKDFSNFFKENSNESFPTNLVTFAFRFLTNIKVV